MPAEYSLDHMVHVAENTGSRHANRITLGQWPQGTQTSTGKEFKQQVAACLGCAALCFIKFKSTAKSDEADCGVGAVVPFEPLWWVLTDNTGAFFRDLCSFGIFQAWKI